MTEITELFDFLRMTSSGISGIGIIAVLFFLWKSGMIQFRKSNGQANGHNNEHERIWLEIKEIKDNHIHTMQEDISDIKVDISYIRGKMDK